MNNRILTKKLTPIINILKHKVKYKVLLINCSKINMNNHKFNLKYKLILRKLKEQNQIKKFMIMIIKTINGKLVEKEIFSLKLLYL